MSYFESLEQAKDALVREFSDRGIHEAYLDFGGPGQVPQRSPTIPTNARSEFLANRAMGDWAEEALARAIQESGGGCMVSHYGNAEPIAAGEPGFKEFYLGGLEEVRKYGKRPDLLVFPADQQVPSDISMLNVEQAEEYVRVARAAIEVRSSKFEVLTYMEARRRERDEGKRPARMTLGFTVKVEDLKVGLQVDRTIRSTGELLPGIL